MHGDDDQTCGKLTGSVEQGRIRIDHGTKLTLYSSVDKFHLNHRSLGHSFDLLASCQISVKISAASKIRRA